MDGNAFDEHYWHLHVPLTCVLPALRRFTESEGIQPVRGAVSYHLVVELEWDSMTDLRAAFSSREVRAVAEDAAHLQAMAVMRSVVFTVRDVLVPQTSSDRDR